MDYSQGRCLLCLSVNESAINICSENGKELNIRNILSTHFWFEIDELTAYSQKICWECWQKTESFHAFYKSVEAAHMQSVKIEKDEESAVCYDDTYEISEVPDPVEIKTEIKTEVEDYQATNTIACTVSEDTSRDADFGENDNDSEGNSKAWRAVKTDYVDKIKEIFDMNCDLCPHRFGTVAEARKHYRESHNIQKGYIKCCNRKFQTASRIVDHIHWHANPNYFACKTCDKTFLEKKGLDYHLSSHVAVEDRNHICQHCNKRFSEDFKLKKHLKSVHVAKSATCDICDKSFKSPSVVRQHKLAIHSRALEQVCDICAKIFTTKGGLQQHMLTHTGGEKRVQCKICRVWMNRSSYCKHKKKHMTEPKMCTICNITKPNIISYQSHMRTVHGPQHNCNLCGKSFKKGLSLKEHMARHSGELLYTCSYCEKAFNSSANMHKHRKHMHYDEWCAERQKRLDSSLQAPTNVK